MTFILASLVLLATLGPTNTLLFTSGALTGLRASLPLLAAELSGYMVSINLLIVVLGPLLVSHDGLRVALAAACAAYLVYAARSLWVNGAKSDGGAVTFSKVFVTTLLNPKALIFASAIIPGGAEAGLIERLPWLAALGLLIASVGTAWICAGATIRTGRLTASHGALICRLDAVALMAFAALMSWSAMASAFRL